MLDLAKNSAVQGRNRVARPQAVRDVVNLDTNFKSVGFPQGKNAGQRSIKIPLTWTLDSSRTHIPETPDVRKREGFRIQVIGQRFGSVRILKNKLRTLVLYPVEHAVYTAEYR